MNKNFTFKKIVKHVKENSNILDELNFTDEEIETQKYRLCNYIENQRLHKESKDKCDVSHFHFIRNERGEITMKHYFCNKQENNNSINGNILISDYSHNDDYKTILNSFEPIYKKNDKREKFVEYFETNFIKKPNSEIQAPNCYLYGPIGSGKSFSGFYLLKLCLHFKKTAKVAYINAKLFCNKISEVYANNNQREQLSDYIDTLLSVDYLFIDDLGTEKHSPSSINRFSHLLKERTKSKSKTTILISSKNSTELKKFYSKLKNIDPVNVEDIIYRIDLIAKENELEV